MNKVSSWTIAILAFSIFGCNNPSANTEHENHELKSVSSKDLNSVKREYNFRTAYFQMTSDTDFPEVYDETVSNIFKKIKIHLSADSIYLNDLAIPINQKESKINHLFNNNQDYNNYKSAFKIGFNEDVSKPQKVIFAEFKGKEISAFQSYFFEGGFAIVSNSNLYLNYKRYIIQYSFEVLKQEQTCSLPFDMWKASRFCESDDRSVNADFCNCEFPLFSLKKDPPLKTFLLENLTEREIKNVYQIDTENTNLDVFVAVAQPMEESTGDYFIVIKNKKTNQFTLVKDESDEFLHSYFFIISKNLKITFFENTGYYPKQKVKAEFQIQTNGKYTMI